jgi:5-methylcytosine-specific restriction endonuclease McrA
VAFSDGTVKRAWNLAGGKCECRRITHDHPDIHCGRKLIWKNRGREGGRGAWEAHHLTELQNGGSDILSNCEILCWECHLKTL